MKHFMKLLSFALMAFIMAIGCKSDPVDFQLDIGGSLLESTTNISASFDVQAANVTKDYFALNAKYDLLTQKDNPIVYEWLLRTFKTPIVKRVGSDGKYDITITGYVSWHGLKFEVNEHWKSPDALAVNNSITTEDATGYYIAQEKSRWRETHARTLTHYTRFDYVGY